MTDVCLCLLVAPEIEEKVLDQLLISPVTTTFSSHPAASHGGHPASLDPREQVLGRGDAALIQVLLSAADAAVLLDELRQLFQGSGLRYWLSPVLTQGEI